MAPLFRDRMTYQVTEVFSEKRRALDERTDE